MKKRYIKPTVEFLGIEEDMPLLVTSLSNDGTDELGSRNSNTTCAEDEDISEDVY